jgi:hypothetical protein
MSYKSLNTNDCTGTLNTNDCTGTLKQMTWLGNEAMMDDDVAVGEWRQLTNGDNGKHGGYICVQTITNI